jgi:hypothetical protein
MTKDDQKMPKNAENFYCEKCNFICSKKSNWDKHLLTLKHLKDDQGLLFSVTKNAENAENLHQCKCGKIYKYKQGLSKHKKNCNEENKSITNVKLLNNENEIVHFLLKENSDFKQLLLEQNKQIIDLVNKTNNMNNSNNIFNNNINCNNNNKTFNLNMFLNETCKNAMNISDFADSIQLQLSDLESVGELGYVNGISNIIIKNLKELDITQRPIHCTDAKREILYIKDKDKWEKEGEQKEIIVKFVNNIANKNIRMLNEFKKKYPDCCKYESKYSDYYSKLIIEAMGGSGGTDAEKHEKIIRKITKEVTIDKSLL